ncbi:hypothetical protein ACE1TF_10835 [Geomicrobium sp. JSM 1781026]
MSIHIVWFRRDLRWKDRTALHFRLHWMFLKVMTRKTVLAAT